MVIDTASYIHCHWFHCLAASREPTASRSVSCCVTLTAPLPCATLGSSQQLWDGYGRASMRLRFTKKNDPKCMRLIFFYLAGLLNQYNSPVLKPDRAWDPFQSIDLVSKILMVLFSSLLLAWRPSYDPKCVHIFSRPLTLYSKTLAPPITKGFAALIFL